MKFAMSTTGVSNDLETNLSSIAQAGFKGIEISEDDLINFQGSIQSMQKLIASQKLIVTAFQKFINFEGLSDKAQALAFDRLEKKFDLVEAIGGNILIMASSIHPYSSEQEEKIINDLGEAATRAQKRGLRIAYIALPWAKNIRTAKEAFKIISKVNHSQLGLALNSLFYLGNGIKVSELRELSVDKIFIFKSLMPL